MFLGFVGLSVLSWVIFFKPLNSLVFEFVLFSGSGKDFAYVIFWDAYSFIFLGVVLLISSMVFFYSMYYMDSEFTRFGFILLLFSFVISMFLLLLSPNLISLLLGWDGLGVTSYLLVIYYSSSSSSVAGMLTFLTNRLGDIFFLISLGAFSLFFDWEKVEGSFLFLAFLMFLTFSTKSAQIPFSSWLPAAMAAPTPVSSLVHSSTLVTAGLYLMIRFSAVLSGFKYFILLAGVITLLVAGLMAVYEWDLKKLIAFSTLSQLGFMVSSFGMGLVWMSFFHLVTHALFKASLFLSAGILIHNADSSQEFRNMTSASSQLFWVSSVVVICLICLCGIPFTSGFYSKDLIIDGGSFSFSIFMLYLCGVFFTVVYSARFFFYSFRAFSMRTGFIMTYEKVIYLIIPLMGLLFFALLGGWYFFESFFSFCFWVLLSSGWKSFYFFFLIFTLALSGHKYFLQSGGYAKSFFLSSLWFLKSLFSSKFFLSIFKESGSTLKAVDQGLWECGGPQGLFYASFSLGYRGMGLQSFFVSLFLIIFLVMLFFL